MSYIISKTFSFSASHQLDGLPEGHQCARLHGHNYQVWLDLKDDQLDDTGFVYDFGQLKPFKDYLDVRFDHRHLNEMLFGNPTAERLAEHLYDVASDMFGERVHAVTVWETATCSARYQP